MRDFGEIRALLHQPPNRTLWSKLCWLVERWPVEAFEDTLLPYIQSHVVAWDDPTIAYVPRMWIDRLKNNDAEPRARMCRSLHLTNTTDEKQALALYRCQHLTSIEHIFYEAQVATTPKSATILGRAPWLGHVRALRLRHGGYLKTFLTQQRWTHVHQLALSVGANRVPELSSLITTAVSGPVETLSMNLEWYGVLRWDVLKHLFHHYADSLITVDMSMSYSIVEMEMLIQCVDALPRLQKLSLRSGRGVGDRAALEAHCARRRISLSLNIESYGEHDE